MNRNRAGRDREPLWIEMFYDGDRVEDPSTWTKERWRVLVWETRLDEDGEVEIDPLGFYIEPVARSMTRTEANRLAKSFSKKLKAAGYQVFNQCYFSTDPVSDRIKVQNPGDILGIVDRKNHTNQSDEDWQRVAHRVHAPQARAVT